MKRFWKTFRYIFFTKDYGDSNISRFMDSMGILIIFLGLYFSAVFVGMVLEILGIVHLNP